jgi:DNA-binding response OmpR family regulator
MDTKTKLIEAPEPRVLPKGKRKALSVLVVDDNDAAAAGIGRLLELSGAAVSYGYDGQQAIDTTADVRPDIILLDVGLPDQDGYSVAKVIRERGYTGRLIALTGFSTDDARERGREAGFDHYLVKPAGLADLKRVIPELS